MMRVSNPEAAKVGLALMKDLADTTRELRLPAEKGTAPFTQQILPLSVVHGTRGYVETITQQINGSYEQGWYDACAVMMRRLVETLIIELFEERGMTEKIQTASRAFLQLDGLIGTVIGEPAWNLSRATKQALSDVKGLGDNSAHGRRFTAHRGDVDNLKMGFRVAVQELVTLGGLRKGASP